ncbi:MAG: hypothetical protein HY508_04685 [Acidobacteria bacterium]|nr:hypothetical protein [Acidobacteriota bacterium]
MSSETLSRRGFIVALMLLSHTLQALPAEQPEKVSFDQFIKKSAVPREVMDQWLRGDNLYQFDPELGYVLSNYLPAWGIDHSATISTVQPNGARTSFMYAGRKSRINTYGDSFTECQQVSDGETWQEYLAAHLGEPIRNFGVGGYGVYQAYRRMIREEKTDHGAEYLILYDCCDDSTRSLLRYRRATFYQRWDEHGSRMFHGNFWAHVEMDLETGRFVEKENPLPTKKSLYHMTEPHWMVEHLKDDLALQLALYSFGTIRDLDREKISKLAARLDFPFDWSQEESALRFQAGALLNRYSQRATLFILDKASAFARENGKKLLVVLNMTADITEMNQRGTRDDQEVVDYLGKEKFDYFDMNEVHLRDFRKSNLSYREYIKPYLVDGGHYSPQGNHFFAYSIKDKVVEWLDPKPIPYQQPDAQKISFEGYLHGGGYH